MSALYRGRLAPSPTGYLHLGHARTFWQAWQRARATSGTLLLRIEDLDGDRCRPEFTDAIYEDLHWLGLDWQEGPDCGGPHTPYVQSARRTFYLGAWERLRAAGLIYRCKCSRKDVTSALSAPHQGDDEPIYPGFCRPVQQDVARATAPGGVTWRFRVPEGEVLEFVDACAGKQVATAGVDFGDFVVWRKDDIPAYQLAVVVDDAAMGITEVVRGADLLTSTFRQLLLYRALELEAPGFYHCPLMTDENGRRLAKRHDSLSLRALRRKGRSLADLLT